MSTMPVAAFEQMRNSSVHTEEDRKFRTQFFNSMFAAAASAILGEEHRCVPAELAGLGRGGVH